MIRAALSLPVLCLLALTALPAQAETLRIGTESGYPPYMSLADTGALEGFDKDLGDAICAILAADCTWTDATFDSLLPDLAAGRYDLVIAALAASPERRRIVDFSVPYFDAGLNVGVYGGLVPGLAIETARIGVQRGTIHAEYLLGTGRDVTLFDSNEAALAALMRREIDLVFTSDLVLREAFETRYPALRQIGEEEVPGWDTAIALPLGRDDLRARIDAAIAQLRADGTLSTLEARWFVAGQSI